MVYLENLSTITNYVLCVVSAAGANFPTKSIVTICQGLEATKGYNSPFGLMVSCFIF